MKKNDLTERIGDALRSELAETLPAAALDRAIEAAAIAASDVHAGRSAQSVAERKRVAEIVESVPR